MIIMGDFNGHIAGRYHEHTNSNGQDLIDFAQHWQLTLLPNDKPTYRGRGKDPTLVDYVMTSPELEEYMISHAVYDSAISADHMALTTNMRPSQQMTVKSKGKRLRTNRLENPKIAIKF